MRAGFRLKAALAAAVHAQLFRLTPAARSHFSSGRVYSLVASDVESLMVGCGGWRRLEAVVRLVRRVLYGS